MPVAMSDAVACSDTEPRCHVFAAGETRDTVGAVASLIVAVTCVLAPTVAVQFRPELLVQPLHPVSDQPASSEADKVTVEPRSKSAEHVAPQSIPVGALVISAWFAPAPERDTVT